MKRTSLPILLFVVFNFICLAVFFFVFWLPRYEIINKSKAALILQERLFESKEENLTEYDNNLLVLQDLNNALAQGKPILVPYADVAGVLAGITARAAALNLEEILFYMGEPSAFESVYILETSAEYRGTYENLCALVKFITDNPLCVTNSAFIEKQEDEANMTVIFTLYALAA